MDPEKDLINFFETQQGGVIGKMSISQHAFSGDWISFIAKDVQHWLETNRVDRPFVPGEDKYPLIVTKVDIKNFFPEVDRRPIEDMLAGIALGIPGASDAIGKGNKLSSRILLGHAEKESELC